MHEWAFATRTFRRIFGMEGGDEGVDDRFAAEGEVGIGATIMERNMFGPIRGLWEDETWTGPRSISSPTASTRRWSERSRQQLARM